MSYAETDKSIDLPFGLWTRGPKEARVQLYSPVGASEHNFNHIRQVATMCPHGRAHLAQPSEYD